MAFKNSCANQRIPGSIFRFTAEVNFNMVRIGIYYITKGLLWCLHANKKWLNEIVLDCFMFFILYELMLATQATKFKFT